MKTYLYFLIVTLLLISIVTLYSYNGQGNIDIEPSIQSSIENSKFKEDNSYIELSETALTTKSHLKIIKQSQVESPQIEPPMESDFPVGIEEGRLPDNELEQPAIESAEPVNTKGAHVELVSAIESEAPVETESIDQYGMSPAQELMLAAVESDNPVGMEAINEEKELAPPIESDHPVNSSVSSDEVSENIEIDLPEVKN